MQVKNFAWNNLSRWSIKRFLIPFSYWIDQFISVGMSRASCCAFIHTSLNPHALMMFKSLDRSRSLVFVFVSRDARRNLLVHLLPRLFRHLPGLLASRLRLLLEPLPRRRRRRNRRTRHGDAGDGIKRRRLVLAPRLCRLIPLAGTSSSSSHGRRAKTWIYTTRATQSHYLSAETAS